MFGSASDCENLWSWNEMEFWPQILRRISSRNGLSMRNWWVAKNRHWSWISGQMSRCYVEGEIQLGLIIFSVYAYELYHLRINNLLYQDPAKIEISQLIAKRLNERTDLLWQNLFERKWGDSKGLSLNSAPDFQC